MQSTAIFAPVLAQVLLTVLVLLTLATTRLRTLRRTRTPPQKLANPKGFDEVLGHLENISENFENLFEMPVLFYVAAVVIFVTGHVDPIFVGAAWGYVLLRALHSLIHCTSNRVTHRFGAFLTSNVVLLFIWIRTATLLFN